MRGHWVPCREGGEWVELAVGTVAAVCLLAAVVSAAERLFPWMLAALGVAGAGTVVTGVLIWRGHRRVVTGIHRPLQRSRAEWLAAQAGRELEWRQARQIERGKRAEGVVISRRDERIGR